MNRQTKAVALGAGGTILAGVLAGWLYANSPISQIDPGALFDPRNILGSIVVVVALFLAARALQPFSVPTWRLIWIAAAVLYPLCISLSFHAITGLARQSVLGSYMQRFQDGFRTQNGRDPTPEETGYAERRVQEALDEMTGGQNVGHQTQSSVNGNWFWGPLWVSLVAGLILKTREYRMKWRLDLSKFIEKVESADDQKPKG